MEIDPTDSTYGEALVLFFSLGICSFLCFSSADFV